MKGQHNTSSHRMSSVSTGPAQDSQFTLLRPRDCATSDILSTFGNFFAHYETETWKHRVKLMVKILVLTLGAGNIWRFPEQFVIHGNATYLYIYTLYSWLFCLPLLVFEISLSQYIVKGFAKMFSICPFLEVITLLMVFYCIMANFVYSLICIYCLMYIYSGFHSSMPHSYCSRYMKNNGCHQDYSNHSYSPERIYFFDYVERAVNINGEHYNWRNTCLLAVIWIIICIIIFYFLFRQTWVSFALSISIPVILLYVFVVSATLDGATNGLYRMFVPVRNDLTMYKTWISPAEQSIVTLGLGTGPLAIIWSTSKINYWSHLDCIIIKAIAYTCSLLAGMIFFNAAGAVARQYNKTIDGVIGNNEEIHTFVLLTQFFNLLNSGLDNFTVCIFYLIIFSSCFYSLYEYTHIIAHYHASFVSTWKNLRKRLISLICFSLFLFTSSLGASKAGYGFLMATNKNFIGTVPVIIVCFELIAVVYFYGLRNFCDDIEFMLGFAPNNYYQFTWTTLPVAFFIFFIVALWKKFQYHETMYDILSLCLIVLLTLLPILGFVIYKCVIGIKDMGIRRLLNPRSDNEMWDNISIPVSEPSILWQKFNKSNQTLSIHHPIID